MILGKIKQPTKVEDFGIDNLPKTRKAQFFDLFKLEWRTLLLLGVIFVVLFIPYTLAIIYENSLLSTLYSDVTNEINDGLISLEDGMIKYRESAFYLSSSFILIKVFCLLIISFGFMGLAKVFKTISYGEGLLFFRDFIKGIKENFVRYFILSLLIIILYSLTSYLSIYLKYASNPSTSTKILFGLGLGLLVFFFMPLYLFSLGQGSFYNVKFIRSINNANSFTLKYFFIDLIFMLPILAIYLLRFIPSILILVIVINALVLLLLPLYALAWHLHMLNLFDENINKDNYPSFYRKGLGEKTHK